MFSYYGSKSKIVHLYPTPKFDKIIEPFAGSARYSLRFWQKDILLVDKYPVIVDVWNYLKNASEKDILGLPKLYNGMDLRKLNLSEIEIKFLGFLAGQGGTQPRFKVSPRSDFNKLTTPNLYKNIANNLFKIRQKIQGVANSNTTEAIWSNYTTSFDYQMKSLF